LTQAICKQVSKFEMADLNGCTWLPQEAWGVLARILPQSAIWTGRIDGRVVCIAGLTHIFPHLAEAWTYLHPDALPHRFWLHRRVARTLRSYVETSELWRVQAVAQSNHPAALEWLEKLKFKQESVMPMAGPLGESMTRYVWFPRGING
jgi:hypothetical protein